MEIQFRITRLLASILFIALTMLSGCKKETSDVSGYDEGAFNISSSESDVQAVVLYNDVFDNVMGVNSELAFGETGVFQGTKEGIEKFYLPCIDSEVIDDMLKLEERFPGICFSMMGLHPCSVKENYQEQMDIVESWLSKRKFEAVGEIGLDFYWDRTFEQHQYTVFHRQIELALHFRLPIVIHSRNSMQECIDVVREHQDGNLRGIFHCFTGNYESAKEVIDAGFYLGIGGVVTYKNAGLAEALKDISLEHMVLETDSPYLSPVPFRGKRNESSYLKYVVEKLAEIKGVSKEEVAALTTANAEKIFGG